ncbi:MAG: hypothetical protein IKD04_02370 [Clostridia bacterium]|nr:hypothetical protein [Clostridia bacterium]
MKRNTKITFCAMMAALSAGFMLLSYFPYLTYAIPAISGLFIMVAVIETDTKWALAAYVASAVIAFLLAEPESKLLYVFLFGYYPILKAVTEKLRKPVLEWIIKLAVFNGAVLAVYLVFSALFQISLEDFGILGKYGAVIFLAIGNAVFLVYDIAVSRMAMFYINIVQPKIRKILK